MITKNNTKYYIVSGLFRCILDLFVSSWYALGFLQHHIYISIYFLFFLSILFVSVRFGFFHTQLVQFHQFLSILPCGLFWVLTHLLVQSVHLGIVLVHFCPVWVIHYFCPFCSQFGFHFSLFISVLVLFHPFLLFLIAF